MFYRIFILSLFFLSVNTFFGDNTPFRSQNADEYDEHLVEETNNLDPEQQQRFRNLLQVVEQQEVSRNLKDEQRSIGSLPPEKLAQLKALKAELNKLAQFRGSLQRKSSSLDPQKDYYRSSLTFAELDREDQLRGLRA